MEGGDDARVSEVKQEIETVTYSHEGEKQQLWKW